jgi:hypothetical protein
MATGGSVGSKRCPAVNCQEPSREALLDTLRITLEEALEANRAEARSAASEHFEEVRIAV